MRWVGGEPIFERNITDLENTPASLFEHPWAYFREIMVHTNISKVYNSNVVSSICHQLSSSSFLLYHYYSIQCSLFVFHNLCFTELKTNKLQMSASFKCMLDATICTRGILMWTVHHIHYWLPAQIMAVEPICEMHNLIVRTFSKFNMGCTRNTWLLTPYTFCPLQK